MKFGHLESSPTKLLEFPEAREGGKPAVPAAGFKSGVRQALAAPPPRGKRGSRPSAARGQSAAHAHR